MLAFVVKPNFVRRFAGQDCRLSIVDKPSPRPLALSAPFV
jgi:hypothetical protein